MNSLAANQFYQATRMDSDDFLSSPSAAAAVACSASFASSPYASSSASSSSHRRQDYDILGLVTSPLASNVHSAADNGIITVGYTTECNGPHRQHQHQHQGSSPQEFSKCGVYGAGALHCGAKQAYYDYDDVIKDYRYSKYSSAYPGASATQFLTDGAQDAAAAAAAGDMTKSVDYHPTAFATASLLHSWTTTIPNVPRVKNFSPEVHKTSWNSSSSSSGAGHGGTGSAQGIAWMGLGGTTSAGGRSSDTTRGEGGLHAGGAGSPHPLGTVGTVPRTYAVFRGLQKPENKVPKAQISPKIIWLNVGRKCL